MLTSNAYQGKNIYRLVLPPDQSPKTQQNPLSLNLDE